jgi:hypothetical protein
MTGIREVLISLLSKSSSTFRESRCSSCLETVKRNIQKRTKRLLERSRGLLEASHTALPAHYSVYKSPAAAPCSVPLLPYHYGHGAAWHSDNSLDQYFKKGVFGLNPDRDTCYSD